MTDYTTPKGVGSLVQADVRTRKTQLLLAATELFVASEAPSKIERHVYAELFRQYVDVTPICERRQIATMLSRCPFAPHDSVLLLSQDEDASVAHRVLAYSPVLSDCDLITAIGRGSRATRRAISLRHEISDAVRIALRRHAVDEDTNALVEEDATGSPARQEGAGLCVSEMPHEPDGPAAPLIVEARPERAPQPPKVAAPSIEPTDEHLRAVDRATDATLQALRDMVRKTPSHCDVVPEDVVPEEAAPETLAAPLASTPAGDADIPVEPEVRAISRTPMRKAPALPVAIETPDARDGRGEGARGEGADDAEPELSTREEFGLRLTPPPVEDPSSVTASAQVCAPLRPDPVAPRGERPSQPGATLAPREARTAPTPGFTGTASGAAMRREGPRYPAALRRFLRAAPEARLRAVAAAKARVLAEMAASRVRTRAKIDTALVACVENSAAARDLETLRRLLSATLRLPPDAIEAMVADPYGEPLIIAAAAIGLPTSRTVSLLLQVSPAASSLERVRELSALCAHIDIRVARHLVAEWTGLAPKATLHTVRHSPVLDDAMRSRRETIVRKSEDARENTVDGDGVLVLRNAV